MARVYVEEDDEEIEVEVDKSGQIVFDAAASNIDVDSNEVKQPPRLAILVLIDFTHTGLFLVRDLTQGW